MIYIVEDDAGIRELEQVGLAACQASAASVTALSL